MRCDRLRKRTLVPSLVAALVCAALAAPAGAEARAWVIRGHGFGHGVGMSQWGAYGFARHGRQYGEMLHHYYRHTRLGHIRAQPVKVLLESGASAVRFSKARSACGRHVREHRAYEFVASGAGVSLANATGAPIKDCGPAAVAGGGPIHVLREGTYRGQIIARAQGGGIQLINRVNVEGYVMGVVPGEVPASWPQPALRAQAVASRTYGLANERRGPFDLYDDARSQTYRGKGVETPATDKAVRASAGKVVMYHDRLAPTYYFSSSGGYTEDVQNAFIGARREPWLVGVRDPYDFYSPEHSWKSVRSSSAIGSSLSGLYSGRLRRIDVLKRGASPRIVSAKVVGSAGGSKVSGATLQSRLGLMSTWEAFKRVSGTAAEARARLAGDLGGTAEPATGAGAGPLPGHAR